MLSGKKLAADGNLLSTEDLRDYSSIRESFLESCYNAKTTQACVVSYLSMLQRRLDDIHLVIDHHFNLIKEVVTADMTAKLMK